MLLWFIDFSDLNVFISVENNNEKTELKLITMQKEDCGEKSLLNE